MTCSLKNLPKILFVPWEFISWQNVDGCDWLLPHLQADKYDGTQDTGKYDVIIYVKSRNLSMMRANKGILQFYATPDPLWHCVEKPNIEEINSFVDGIVVHTPGLAYDLHSKTGLRAHIVPDGIDPSFPGCEKFHLWGKPRYAWFGTSPKFNTEVKELLSCMVNFFGHIDFTVIADQPVMCPFEYNYVKWTPTFYKDLLEYDVVINPLDKTGLRSRNKSFIAWNMGLPVIETINDITRFQTGKERVIEVNRVKKEVLPAHDIKHSAERWLELIRSYGR